MRRGTMPLARRVFLCCSGAHCLMANRTKLTAKKKQAFLDMIANGWSVTRACREVGISRTCAYEHRNTDEAFATAWDDAWEQGGDVLEDEMRRRAFDGSDTLLIFALKGRKPEKYKDRVQAEHTGKDGGPVRIHTIVVEKPGDE